MTNAIEVHDLRVNFGPVEAVGGVTFSAKAGEVTALLGRNGAGKSTTMRVLSAIVPPTSGHATVAGFDVAKDPMTVKYVVGYCPDIGGLVPRATPWEHLQLQAHMRRLVGWEARAEELLTNFELAGEANRVTSGFSHGMSRRLSVALAALANPDVLLLDEPFDGVDPLGVEATFEEIRKARERGSAVVISTHLRDLAMEVADSAVVLRGGSQVATMPASDLSGDEGGRKYRELLT